MDNIKNWLSGTFTELNDIQIDSLASLMLLHKESGANPITAGMSVIIIARLFMNNKNLVVSTDKSTSYNESNVIYNIDFDINEYSLIGNPYQLIENALINNSIAEIEEGLLKSKYNTLYTRGLVYDIAEVKEPNHYFTIKLKYLIL